MGKRSNFERVKNDFYSTPIEAVIPLMPHLPKAEFVYAEPCAGDGRLVDHICNLTKHKAMASIKSDIEPQADFVTEMDAFEVNVPMDTDFIITNPLWSRKLLHPMIEHFSRQRPTWFLFDADWMHTKQAREHLRICEKIVALGRVKWFENSNGHGKDNACWYLFDNKSN